MICHGPHSHINPCPICTPASIEETFLSLLDSLGWILANATPRQIILDTVFMTGLQNVIGWKGYQDPCLSDLHPSLGNADHAPRLINKLQFEKFPEGTGFKGGLFYL